ncbi:MAG: hypothetical protein HYX87_08235 [Chloroflexi bacterium]|nr:hypothetical protein [Chloroflexota bacterium]
MKLVLKTNATVADQLLAALGIFVLVLAMGAYTVQKKAADEVVKLQKQVDAATSELRDLRSLGSLESARKQLDDLRSKAVPFPSFGQADEAATSLWTWAQESRVNLEQMGYNLTSSTMGDWSYPAHNFILSGKGTPSSVVDFLQRVESSSLKTASVSSLQITPAKDDSWQFSFMFTIWSQATKVEKQGAKPK